MNFTKKITSLALIIAFVLVAFGLEAALPKKQNTKNFKPLIAQLKNKVKQQKLRLSRQTKLLKFTISPAQPKAGEPVTIFIQPLTGVSDSETLLTAQLNSVDVTATMEQPAQELWVFDAGTFSELRSHEFKAQIFLRDKHTAQIIMDAIKTLNTDIANLNDQIANEIDPEIIADLTNLRDDKVAQKNELVLVLADLNTQIGEETFHFSISANSELTDYPVITSVHPNVIKSNSEIFMVIQGSNFGLTPTVKIDGSPVTAWIYEGEIHLNTPLLSQGPHTIEVSITSDDQIKNTIIQNAIWATDGDVANPMTPPTAIATAVVNPVTWGNNLQVSGANSFDSNGRPLQYLWRFVSVPDGTHLPNNGFPLSLDQVYSFAPQAPGLYVLRLDVSQTAAPFLTSSPSLIVVEVQGPANSAPFLVADSINVMTEATATRQLLNHDPDHWQRHSYHIVAQGTLGTATVNGNGLISYEAGNTAGTDSLKILVVDNGIPALSHTITLTVNVSDTNSAPLIGPLNVVTLSEKLPVAVNVALTTFSDPDGFVEEIRFDFGDGNHQYAGNYAQASHNYAAYGTYNGTVTVKDNFGLTSSQNFTVVISNTDQPIVKMSLDKTSCSAPCTVTVDASATSDNDGIAQYRWRWADLPETLGTDTEVRTITNPGTYWIRLRARDANGVQGEGMAYVFVDVPPPAFGSPPSADLRVNQNRVNVINSNITFNGSSSFDPNPSGSIINYDWNFGCYTPNCQIYNGGATPVFQYTEPTNYYPTVTVQSVTDGFRTSTPFFSAEMINVNTGSSPRALIWGNGRHSLDFISGDAPFAVNFDGSGSYDYDGSIVNYQWDFGDGQIRQGVRQRKIYSTPGVYFVNLRTTDDDGNYPFGSIMVEVLDPSMKRARKTKGFKKLSEVETTSRAVLVRACSAKNAAACYDLAKVLEKDGNSFAAGKVYQRSCGLKHRLACEVGKSK